MIFYKFTKTGKSHTYKGLMAALTAMEELGYPLPEKVWVYRNSREDLAREESLVLHTENSFESIKYLKVPHHTQIPTEANIGNYLKVLINKSVVKSKAERFCEVVYKQDKFLGLLVYMQGYNNLDSKNNVLVYDKELTLLKKHVSPKDTVLQRNATKTLLGT